MKRVECLVCGKKVKQMSSHKRYCTGAEQSAELPVGEGVAQVAEQEPVAQSGVVNGDLAPSEAQNFDELNNEWESVKKDLDFGDEKPTVQELKSGAPVGVEKLNVSEGALDFQRKQYVNLANSLHEAFNQFLVLLSKNKVSIGKVQLDRLNECGAQVLQKYDASGKIAQYAPELAYVLTLGEVAGQLWIAFNRLEVEKNVRTGESAKVEGHT